MVIFRDLVVQFNYYLPDEFYKGGKKRFRTNYNQRILCFTELQRLEPKKHRSKKIKKIVGREKWKNVGTS